MKVMMAGMGDKAGVSKKEIEKNSRIAEKCTDEQWMDSKAVACEECALMYMGSAAQDAQAAVQPLPPVERLRPTTVSVGVPRCALTSRQGQSTLKRTFGAGGWFTATGVPIGSAVVLGGSKNQKKLGGSAGGRMKGRFRIAPPPCSGKQPEKKASSPQQRLRAAAIAVQAAQELRNNPMMRRRGGATFVSKDQIADMQVATKVAEKDQQREAVAKKERKARAKAAAEAAAARKAAAVDDDDESDGGTPDASSDSEAEGD